MIKNSKALFKKLSLIGYRLGHLLLPAHCLLCRQQTVNNNGLCTSCDAQYFGVPQHRCSVCALPLPHPLALPLIQPHFFSPAPIYPVHNTTICGTCVAHPPSFDATLTLANYAPALDSLALGLKFHARLAVANEWARRLARATQEIWPTSAWPHLMVPVPLSARRLSQRGYNQAWEIARPLARALSLPAQAGLLKRIRDTPPQLHLNAQERHSNLSKAFELTPCTLSGQHIAVVDDVMTSSATLECIAKILKKAGAQRVTNFVALRTKKSTL